MVLPLFLIRSRFRLPEGKIDRFVIDPDSVLIQPGKGVLEPIFIIPVRKVFPGMSATALLPVPGGFCGNQGQVQKVSHRVGIMIKGKMVAEGTIDALAEEKFGLDGKEYSLEEIYMKYFQEV